MALSARELALGRQLPPLSQRRYWQSRSALRQWLAGVLGCPPAEVPLHSQPVCPQKLLDGAGWVSLSHSGDGLLLGFSQAPIGVDLEAADRPVAPALMRRWFPPEEVAQLQMVSGEHQGAALLTSWVLKESAIKWRRSSLATELSSWQLDHASGRLVHRVDGVQPAWLSGVAVGWLWAGVGEGMPNAALEVVI